MSARALRVRRQEGITRRAVARAVQMLQAQAVWDTGDATSPEAAHPRAARERCTELLTTVAGVGHEDDVRHGECIRVRDGQQGSCGAEPGEMTAGRIVKLQLRRTAAANDLEVTPEDAKGVARANRLHPGFFR